MKNGKKWPSSWGQERRKDYIVPLPPNFFLLILMIWNPCHQNLVVISSLLLKCQVILANDILEKIISFLFRPSVIRGPCSKLHATQYSKKFMISKLSNYLAKSPKMSPPEDFISKTLNCSALQYSDDGNFKLHHPCAIAISFVQTSFFPIVDDMHLI